MFAQNEVTCGSDDIHRILMETDENYRDIQLNFERKMKDFSAAERTVLPVYTIPVVVHVIHLGEAIGVGTNISDAQVESAIDNLTDVYRNNTGSSFDVEVEFALAVQDPNCNATTGIIRVDGTSITSYSTDGCIKTNVAGTNELEMKATSVWPNSSYYNIWIVSEINNNGGGSGIQGFAYFPGASADRDGAVMLYNAFGYDPGGALGYNLKSYTNLNTTAVHELGHGFDLYHTFSGDRGINGTGASQCPGAADGCVSWNGAAWEYLGDCVSDTPPHIRSSSDCDTGGTNACDGGSSKTLFVHNFMDYSSSACKEEFTADQSTRMRTAIEDLRPGLLTSRGLDTPLTGSYTPPISPSCTPATSAIGMGGLFMGIGHVSLNTINNSSGYPSQDNSVDGYLDATTNCQATTEIVEGSTYTLDVDLLSVNNQGVKAWIDYNNNGTYEDATELILNSTGHKDSNPASVTFMVPASVNGIYLRMRVLCDFNSVGNSCYDPTYGQAEDYAVLIEPDPLPVELLSFTGKKEKETVDLTWETASELNNDYFILERSSDGRNFSELVTIQGLGTSEAANTYRFSDAKPFAGINYYRLIQVDNDGTKENAGGIVAVEFSTERNMTLFPNPMSGDLLYLNYASLTSGALNIEVFDLTGKSVHALNKDVLKGENTIELSFENLNSGLYYIQTTHNGEIRMERFVKK